MNGFALDFRLTLRSLLRTPAILFIALLTIALGVGVNTAMFSVLNAVLLQPLPYEQPDRLVALWPEKRWGWQMLEDVQQRVSSFEASAAYRTETYTLLGGERPEPVPVAVVSPEWFSVLRAMPVLGRTFRASDETRADGPVVVLSHGLWQRAFGGDAGIIGKQVRLTGAGSVTRTVVGVMGPDFTAFPSIAQAWYPMVGTGQQGFWGGYGMSVLGRLKTGVPAARASAELRGLVKEFTPMHPTQFRAARYSPVDVVPQLELMTRNVRAKLLILFGAVVFILLIACTNVANLLLARAHGRQREVGLQVAIGCSRGRILRQVLMEGVVVSLAGGAIGLIAALAAMPIIRSSVGDYIPRSAAIGVDLTVLAFALGVSLLTGLVFGALPAIRAASTAPGDVMRATAGRGQSQGRAASRVNNIFVVTEIALSLLMLVGSGLMLKTLWQLGRVDLGFNPTNILTMQLSIPGGRYDSMPRRAALLREFQDRLGAVAGVERVATIDALPLSGTNSGWPYRVVGQEQAPGTSLVVNARAVTPEYFETMGMKLIAGRQIASTDLPTDSLTPGVVVVNEAFAKLHWADGKAIGQRITGATGNDPGVRIVGIVSDARQASPATNPDPEIYEPVSQGGWPSGFLVLRGSKTIPEQRPVLDVIKAIDPDIGIRNVRSMDEVVHAAAKDTRFYTRLLTVFAVVAMVLGIVGVYGVMTHAISRRTREFGVRLALGATASEVRRHVLVGAMTPVAVGLALGIGGSLAMTKLIAGLLYGVSAGDPWVLGGGALLLGLAAAAAALVPAHRAARLSPLDALRQE